MPSLSGFRRKAIERWRQSQVVVIQFDAADCIVTAKAPSLP
jgi:hypothetical protein